MLFNGKSGEEWFNLNYLFEILFMIWVYITNEILKQFTFYSSKKKKIITEVTNTFNSEKKIFLTKNFKFGF